MSENEDAWEAAVEAAADARVEHWRAVGETSDDVLAPIINPMFMGGPEWPTRPGWRTIRRQTSTILSSEGLSDPWMDGERLGQRLEVMVEFPGTIDDARDTPLFSALMEISHLAAGNDVASLLEQMPYVSTEVGGERFPESFRNEHGRVGFVLGIKAADLPAAFDLPAGKARLVVATLLTRAELDAIVESGAKRQLIGDALSKLTGGHLSRFDRASVALPASPGPKKRASAPSKKKVKASKKSPPPKKSKKSASKKKPRRAAASPKKKLKKKKPTRRR